MAIQVWVEEEVRCLTRWPFVQNRPVQGGSTAISPGWNEASRTIMYHTMLHTTLTLQIYYIIL